MTVISRLDQANQQMAAAMRAQRRRARERHRTEAPIRAIDELIADLEELLLLGHKRVPVSYETRLGRLAASLAPPPPDLHSRVKITHLMDQLYAEQERLLRARTGVAGDDDADAD